MRKLIFFVVLLCMVGYSQVIQYRDTSYTGGQQFRTVMPTQPLPVKDSLGLVNLDELPYIYDALSSGVPVSYDTLAAGDSVVSTTAYGTWEFENQLDDGKAFRFIYKYYNTVGYTLTYNAAAAYVISTIAGATIETFSYSSASNGDKIKIHRTINGTFYLTVNNELLGSCTDNTIRGCDSIYVTDGYVANLTITPLTLLDVTKDLSLQNKLLRDSLATVNNELRLQKTLLTSIETGVTSSSNNYGALRTTTGTTIDSVSFGFDTQYVTFINDGTSTDTLYVSTTSAFGSSNVIVRLGGEGFTKKMKTSKLYYKVGNVPLASKKIRIEGY